MKPNWPPLILLAVIVITAGVLVALDKPQFAAFLTMAGAIVQAVLPSIRKETPNSERPTDPEGMPRVKP